MNELLTINPENPLPIRTTPDQLWMSVFDLLQGVTEAKNPRDLWSEIKTEVVGNPDNLFSEFQFEGSGQKVTPVCNREGFVKILTVLLTTGRLPREKTEKLGGMLAAMLLGEPAQAAKRLPPALDVDEQARLGIMELARWGDWNAKEFSMNYPSLHAREGEFDARAVTKGLALLAKQGSELAKDFLHIRSYAPPKQKLDATGFVSDFVVYLRARWGNSSPGAPLIGDCTSLMSRYRDWCRGEGHKPEKLLNAVTEIHKYFDIEMRKPSRRLKAKPIEFYVLKPETAITKA